MRCMLVHQTFHDKSATRYCFAPQQNTSAWWLWSWAQASGYEGGGWSGHNYRFWRPKAQSDLLLQADSPCIDKPVRPIRSTMTGMVPVMTLACLADTILFPMAGRPINRSCSVWMLPRLRCPWRHRHHRIHRSHREIIFFIMKSSILTFFLSLILGTTLAHGVTNVVLPVNAQAAIDAAQDGDSIGLLPGSCGNSYDHQQGNYLEGKWINSARDQQN